MNKFEKLIEYIINDEDQKARELFHSIVVEKSRDIYESIVQDEMEESHVHGDMSEINDQIASEETMGEDEDFNLTGDDDADGGPDGSLPADGDFGPADGENGEAGEHAELEDKVMSIDAKVDELLAKFDDIIGGGDDFSSDDKGGQFGGDQDMDQPEEQPEEDPIAEGEQPEWLKKGSGKSGSAASGKSGTSGSGKMESRKMSTTELMREYVDKIGDIYGGPGDAAEGTTVGTGTGSPKKVSVYTKSTEGPGANFGGEVVKTKGEEASPDGKPVPKPNNEYTKGQGTIKSGNVNVPGGKAGAPKSTGDSYEKGGDNQGDARGAMAGTGAKSEKQGEKNTKSPLVQNAGKK